ncbi:hypothetical protein [uncultured Caulobacter sp.]|uniref:hypothetical protein n=1 Tax=uncultured Caulobacter sp. TaxID=158749 RepID=UPI0026225FD2|nr:hypothetical protein [uncultured Caulobacter sp.]
MSPNDEEDTPAPRRWSEPIGWVGCLLAAVMPTAVLSTVVQAFERSMCPAFTPLLFIGLFTMLVLIVRPWTMR